MISDSKRILANIRNTSMICVLMFVSVACNGTTTASQPQKAKTEQADTTTITQIIPHTPESRAEYERDVDSLRRQSYEKALKTLNEKGEQALTLYQRQIIQEFQAEQAEK